MTPHPLRRTYASLRAALGDDPVYTKAVKRRAKLSGVYFVEYEKALAWTALPTLKTAQKGTISTVTVEAPAQSRSHLA